MRLDFPSKPSMPTLAVPVPFIVNATVAQANATADDPWATGYLYTTPAGSGAHTVTRWDQGQQIVYNRNDAWVGGPRPKIRRVIKRKVPSSTTRRALIERGDVQVSFDIPDRDTSELVDTVDVYSTLIQNRIHCVCPDTRFEPFQDVQVRKAIASAIPYLAIFQSAAYGRKTPMWVGPADITDAAWPRPVPYKTDTDKAREHLEASAFADGLDVTMPISFHLASGMEQTALLIEETPGQRGVTTQIDSIPGANWRTVALVDNSLDFHLGDFGGWLSTPDCHFFWAYQKDRLFNSSNYANDEAHELTARTLQVSVDDPEWALLVKRMFEIVIDDLPRIPLSQPALNMAANGVSDCEFWFHRQIDLRRMTGV
ncbi:MAG: ABC transporter substrate-binding protein [Jannaschia sp.]